MAVWRYNDKNTHSHFGIGLHDIKIDYTVAIDVINELIGWREKNWLNPCKEKASSN
ncbi:hypothetical protein D3C78_1835340 [compost metagenome]